MIPEDVVLALCDFETTGVDPDVDRPIEVAILFLNHRLNVLASFESLIDEPDPTPPWGERELAAFRVHGIPQSALQGNDRDGRRISAEVLGICERLNPQKKKRIVLCSDNAQFEYRFMRRLFGPVWPFHYCAWDTSLLLEATGIGDPVPVHRAMADVGLLYRALLAAMERLRPEVS